MNAYDLVNGLFELGGALLLLLNVRQLIRDKRIAGVHWGPTVFFTAWGVWNLWFYPALGQTLSFIGGCVLTAVNVAWLVLLFWYSMLEDVDLSIKWLDDVERKQRHVQGERNGAV